MVRQLGGRLIMNMPRRIETERLVLRAIEFEDSTQLFISGFRDPDVMHFLEWTPHHDLSETQTLVDSWIRAWENNSRFMYSVITKASMEVVGCTSLEPNKGKGCRMEIGGLLTNTRTSRGSGFMREAWSGLSQLALRLPDIFCIWAVCDVDNQPSQRALETIGMQREGRLRRYVVRPNISEEPRDVYHYSLIR
jgi:ribosomal-protein-alanine N-acetyltransferase